MGETATSTHSCWRWSLQSHTDPGIQHSEYCLSLGAGCHHCGRLFVALCFVARGGRGCPGSAVRAGTRKYSSSGSSNIEATWMMLWMLYEKPKASIFLLELVFITFMSAFLSSVWWLWVCCCDSRSICLPADSAAAS